MMGLAGNAAAQSTCGQHLLKHGHSLRAFLQSIKPGNHVLVRRHASSQQCRQSHNSIRAPPLQCYPGPFFDKKHLKFFQAGSHQATDPFSELVDLIRPDLDRRIQTLTMVFGLQLLK
eukprot:GHUV01047653.1.p1 GENE.GHUV01047653.1~~GHUV01047653.1.p1  ORF type:complete len:117 (+),score=14.89 GHUV01047653.1:89-439(+)